MNFSRLIFFISLFMIVCTAANSFAQEPRGAYILLKPGGFTPTGDLEDKGFDSTFSGEIVVGSHFHPNLAVEAGVGYYQTEATSNDFAEEAELSVIPVTVTLKGVIPFIGAELNAGVGPGVYFTNIDLKGNNAGLSTEEHHALFGGHVLIGATINISPTVYIGGEGKYIFTNEADVLGSKIKLDGFITSLVIGFRL